ncbi:MAG: efflux RND transporter periplasmic adaptor subunit [Acidobacteriia bacterium]|nr:efflux RND transporter periplasmic adaptor subunit [Terriglobia bacterium]
MKYNAGFLPSLGVLLVAVAGLAACNRTHEVAASVPETVRGLTVVQVRQQAVPDQFQATGTIRSWRTAPVAAQIMANVTGVLVREGDTVKRGQLLVTMDDSQLRASTERGQAALQAAENEIAAAESEQTLAKTSFDRLQYLFDKGTISAQEYDNAKARMQTTRARHDLAQSNRSQAAAALDQNRILQSYTRVVAPFDGVVTERHVDPGALATPGLPLLMLEQVGRYRLEATVDESDLKFVRLGESVPISVDALAGEPLQGKVVQIIPAADQASRSFLLKIDLPENSRLRSGLFARAAFVRGQKQAISVPRSAVIDRGQLQTAYVLGENNIATLRYVTLGNTTIDQTEVLSGLSDGDRLIANPAGRELAGKRVEVR